MALTKARLLKHDFPVHGRKWGHYERGLCTGGISASLEFLNSMESLASKSQEARSDHGRKSLQPHHFRGCSDHGTLSRNPAELKPLSFKRKNKPGRKALKILKCEILRTSGGPACLQKCVGDYVVYILEDFAGDFPIVGTFPTKNGDKTRAKRLKKFGSFLAK